MGGAARIKLPVTAPITILHRRWSTGRPRGSDRFVLSEIYNEDWFFLLGETALRPVGQVGVAVQMPYDPFATPERARQQEFGDVLAEGLFALFDDGGTIADADRGHWTAVLAGRLAFIDQLRGRIEHQCDALTGRDKQILESLSASCGRLRFIRATTVRRVHRGLAAKPRTLARLHERHPAHPARAAWTPTDRGRAGAVRAAGDQSSGFGAAPARAGASRTTTRISGNRVRSAVPRPVECASLPIASGPKMLAL